MSLENPALPLPNDQDRRDELADFLRTRRARVKPPEHAAPFSRRRTPGLRREEVAEMSGVSASWYTWLEQGRDVHPSGEFLIRLSKVLKLSPFETRHLFDLTGRESPELPATGVDIVPEALRHLVLEVLSVPAFVMGERFDFLLWNKLVPRYIMDLDGLPPDRRTLLDLIFMEHGIRRARKNWAEEARRAVAEFRWSVGKQIGSPWVKELVGRLQRECPEFASLWRQHDLQERRESRVLELEDERYGKRSYLRSIFVPLEAEHLRLVTLTPIDPAACGTRKKSKARSARPRG